MRRVAAIGLLLGAACHTAGAYAERGELEWEQQSLQAFRAGERIEFVPVAGAEGPDLLRACGFLTEDALVDIHGTLALLDPATDYSLGEGSCEVADSPSAKLHVHGAEHGPFSCDHWCCRDELRPIALVYLHALNNVQGVVLEQDGVPTEVIDPDRSCTPAD